MNAVIDRRLASRLFPTGDPVGQPILIQGREGEGSRPYTVVGVVSDMRHDLFDQAGRPHVFVPVGSLFRAMLTIHARTTPGAPETAVLGTIRRELQALDPRLPILSARTMAEHRVSQPHGVERPRRGDDVRDARRPRAAAGDDRRLRSEGVRRLAAGRVRSGSAWRSAPPAATWRDCCSAKARARRSSGLLIGVLLAAGIGKLASGLLYQVSPFDPARADDREPSC